MRRLVIAIDCDDVLIDSTEYLVDTYNMLYGTKVQLVDAYTSTNTDWGVDHDELIRRKYEIQQTGEFAQLPPRTDAVRVIKKLATDHEPHLVTARDAAVLRVTDKMLAADFPDCFTKLHHIGRQSKGDVCRQIGAEILIDDNLKHLLDAEMHGIKEGLWFGHYSWQAKDRALVNGFTVICDDWDAVEEEVRRVARA